MPRLTTRLLAAVTALVIAATACTNDPVEGSRPVPLLIFAAASLTDAFADLEVAFEAANPDIDIEVSVAGSSALRLQVDQGAPADVIAVANERVMTQLAGEGHVEGFTVFATNRLVVVSSVAESDRVSGPDSLADSGLLIGLCAPQVPCGEYALEALDQAGVKPSVDTEEPDARALTAKLASGELDAGVIYATDAASRAGNNGNFIV